MLVVVCVVATAACTAAPVDTPGAEIVDRSVVVAADPGAEVRLAALARYDGDGHMPVLLTPPLVGLGIQEATTALDAAGLVMDLVPFDRTSQVSAQFPAAGEPTGPDGTVEVWLGHPPEATPTPTATAVATPDPSPSPTPTATPTPAPSDEPVGDPLSDQDVTTRYVLPPHTPGRLRINPRGLPALPPGTELSGMASWYGPGFHGLQTACGGTYDQNGPTLAARELRCGTVVRITGPSGLTVQATVTDWGPAEWTGRRFDLSAAVFNAIAPLGTGVIGVRVITVNAPA